MGGGINTSESVRPWRPARGEGPFGGLVAEEHDVAGAPLARLLASRAGDSVPRRGGGDADGAAPRARQRCECGGVVGVSGERVDEGERIFSGDEEGAGEGGSEDKTEGREREERYGEQREDM